MDSSSFRRSLRPMRLVALAAVVLGTSLALPHLAGAASPSPRATPSPSASLASPSPAPESLAPLPTPEAGRLVYDFAGIFQPATIASAEQNIGAIEASGGPQITVITLAAGRSVTPTEAENDARRVMDEWWGTGSAAASDGLVILYDVDATLQHAQVVLYGGNGLGARGLPDETRQHILDDTMMPLLRTGDFDGSLNAALIAISTQLSPANPVDVPADGSAPSGGGIALPGTVGSPPFEPDGQLPLVLIFALGAVLVGLAIAFGSGSRARQGGSLRMAVAQRRRNAPLYLSTAQRETAAALRRLVSAGLVTVVRDAAGVTGVRVVAGAAVPDDLDEQSVHLLEQLRQAADVEGFVARVTMPATQDPHRAARDAFAGRQPRQAAGDWGWWWPVVLFAAEPQDYARAVADLSGTDAATPDGAAFTGVDSGSDAGTSGGDAGSGGGGGWSSDAGTSGGDAGSDFGGSDFGGEF